MYSRLYISFVVFPRDDYVSRVVTDPSEMQIMAIGTIEEGINTIGRDRSKDLASENTEAANNFRLMDRDGMESNGVDGWYRQGRRESRCNRMAVVPQRSLAESRVNLPV